MIRRGSAVSVILVLNLAVFVLCSLTGGSRGAPGSVIFEWMVMSTPAVLQGQVWRIITANYLHWDFGHIFMNMLMLFFLGPALESAWGPRRFFKMYTIAGVLGSLFYIVLGMVGWLDVQGHAAGASGCVLSLLGAFAVRDPHTQFLIYFIIPIRARTLALLFGAWYLINVIGGGPNAGGDACHLVGLVYGAWCAWRGSSTISYSPSIWSKLKRTWRKSTSSVRATRMPWTPSIVSEETLDDLLRKVRDRGIQCLSEEEKRTLTLATEQRRRQ